ncbi:MAG: DUF362 domain-containing protein [Proteobacteria bacterium]|nr:DUF362 domain-containing protein [Pseudomonadota bacterium]MBU4297247.1 DUF362 domain-containing protein [Pseudomonadota bacterium]MCG2747698.1 DUF362 domain-containing protein [Desulfobulbaceae bacterium]
MEISSQKVGILRYPTYDRQAIKEQVATLAQALGFRMPSGCRVVLKPNLVSGRGHTGLACTHPEFVAAVAEWCLDCGAKVRVGDSPAFGRAPAVMRTCGIAQSLQGLPVELIHFGTARQVRLACGERLTLAAEALDCDFLINLPKFKAHSQTLISLAVKNYFGTVKGFGKALLHQKLGEDEQAFCRMLVDLLAVLPGGISFVDGVQAMHRRGPLQGEIFPLGMVGGSVNPVALDTAMLLMLGMKPEQSMIWRETARQQLAGAWPEELVFPLLQPWDVPAQGFVLPSALKPIPFKPLQVFNSMVKRVRLLLHS